MKEKLLAQHQLRTKWKKDARGRMKKHYWMMVLICLMMAVIGVDYASSLSAIKTNSGDEESTSSQVFSMLAKGRIEEGEKLSRESDETKQERDTRLGIVAIEHTRGVAAELVNGVTSGQLFVTVYEALRSMTNSNNVATVLFILGSALVVLIGTIFVLDVLHVIFLRFFLEMRIYDTVPLKRIFFLLRVKRWLSVAKVILLKSVYLLLWLPTVVGVVIKGYSYMLVPYIAAENPDIKPKEAIALSQKMMDGHKMEAFWLTVSFLPWKILGGLTWGLAGIFFTNPYSEATASEYYAFLRAEAIKKQLPGCELLNDVYLFEKADEAAVREAYADAAELLQKQKDDNERVVYNRKKGVFGILRNWFGIIAVCDQEEQQFEQNQANKERLKDFANILNGKMYPRRLFPLHEKDDIRKMSSVHYDRNYQLTSLILMFFTMCMVGWLWEVSLHLVSTGKFVNRGVLHGPWLPIYGTGGMLILIVLKKLRKYPALEFLAAVVMCGILEYTTGWYLEYTHNGQKWWDYSGYFLNIHGRVCAEGLLIFGLGGLGIVYVLAPFLDNMFRRVKRQITVPVCAVLLLCYIGDTMYSKKHPNMGPGVTNTEAQLTDYMGDTLTERTGDTPYA